MIAENFIVFFSVNRRTGGLEINTLISFSILLVNRRTGGLEKQ